VPVSSDADVQLLRKEVGRSLAELSPIEEVRRLMATAQGWDRLTWVRLCGELGLAGMAVPEEYGGSGFGPVELAAVFEEAGRTLLCAPLLACAGLSAPLLLALSTPQALALLPPMCAGDQVVTVAVGAGPDASGAVRATVGGDTGWQLDGVVSNVIDGAHSDVLLVVAAGPDGLGVWLVDPGARGLTITPLVTLDQTRKQARLGLADTPATLLGRSDEQQLTSVLDVSRALLAAEQVGGAQRCLDLTVDYVKTRVQFGRPIGSFQAVKQKTADMLIAVESARSAAKTAVLELATLGPEHTTAPSIAKAFCSEAFHDVSTEAIQLHGGIGFTWEHDAHLYLKRALTSEVLLGNAHDHYERLAKLLDERQP
jgi:acyl-CoA dehydrogenase